jgi:mannose-1-phosphate guanylyltransferase
VKAFLLAAGLGTRLRPITNTTPKCLVPIDGRPLLDIWLDAFAAAGVDEVLVNLHHLPSLVDQHLGLRTGGPEVIISYEPELLGSAGTLAANKDWVASEDRFLVCYADNLTDFDLRRLIEFHEQASLASLALFHAEVPSACGIVELDDSARVISFVEKPARPASDLANAGMYVFESGVFSEIEGPPPVDIGFHLLPRLVGRARGLAIDAYIRDIGTIDAYQRAQREWHPGVLR